MNIILGGGLISLLARDILGDGWTIVPVGKSRYYSFEPPLADNFVIKDPDIDEYMRQYAVIPIMHRVGYSYGGELLFNTTLALNPYLQKLYGADLPPHAEPYLRNRIEFFGCGNCYTMYKSLSRKYNDELLANSARYGKPTKISQHIIQTENGVHEEYDRMVSTIPLPALLALMGIDRKFPSRDSHFYHMRTDCLDFENATKVFVADPEIEFHTVMMLNRMNYIFVTSKRIESPGQYFMAFMKRFDLIAETVIEQSVCCGPIPMVNELGDAGITCIGSSAVWDDCLDVGSCIKRIIKLET